MQLLLLADGAIAAAVVRGDPKVARAARAAAATLLSGCGFLDVVDVARSKAHGTKKRVEARLPAKNHHLRLAPLPRPLCVRTKSEMRGAISERKREPLKTP